MTPAKLLQPVACILAQALQANTLCICTERQVRLS